MPTARPSRLLAAQPTYQIGHSPAQPWPGQPGRELAQVSSLLASLYGVALHPMYVFVAGSQAACALWCPRCGRVSWNGTDVEHAYCGACHVFWEG